MAEDGDLRLYGSMRRQFLLRSATGDDLQPRIDQHNSGAFPGYTFRRRPVVLVWSERFDRITDGIAAERQIKGWSRAKKEALIQGDWAKISELSRLSFEARRRRGANLREEGFPGVFSLPTKRPPVLSSPRP